MVREFSEEKRQEIFRALDEIDNREWKSFMEWCGSSAEEFGDWPDKLAVSAYTRYVDEYHQKVLELNEMTRQRVNTVFENVAEIDARYAARMRECQKKIKEQIAMVHTMTEFMQSMTDGNPNMALLTKESVNENIRTGVEVNPPVTSPDDTENETNIYFLNDYFYSGEEFYEDEIFRILDGALLSADITQEEYNNLKELFTEMFLTTDDVEKQNIYQSIVDEYNRITKRNQYIEEYINESFLREIGFDIEALGIEDFVVELKRGMIQYDITGETSIQMFLATCMSETGGRDLRERENDNGDAGAGLIQLTGDAQNVFLEIIQLRYDSESEEYKLIEAIRSGFEYDIEHNYIGYHQPADVTVSPSEYIAENYPIESAAWCWGGYNGKCIVYTDATDRSQGCVTYSINQYIELFRDSCEGREEDMFLATQYYVNGATLKAPYLQQLCEGLCDENQNRYCITYFSDGKEVDLAMIEEAARNNDNIISELEIEKVAFRDVVKNAPNGYVARLWYYYRVLALGEEMQ